MDMRRFNKAVEQAGFSMGSREKLERSHLARKAFELEEF
jgi:hypothetical protein